MFLIQAPESVKLKFIDFKNRQINYMLLESCSHTCCYTAHSSRPKVSAFPAVSISQEVLRELQLSHIHQVKHSMACRIYNIFGDLSYLKFSKAI